MAHTKVTKTYSQNTGAANTFSYSGSFDVFKATEVEVELDNVALTYTASTINESASPREYTVDVSAKTIHIGGANLSSGTVVIQPVTDMGAPTPRATYAPGSSITAEDLNNNQTQLMRKAMEYDEQKLSSRGGTMTGHLTMGEDQTIIFEGATDDAYETTLTVTDPTADRTITIPNITGTVVTTGDTGTVTATMLAANSVDSSELVDGSIDTSHIGNLQVTTDKIAADAVTGAKIADDAINSEHYTDGSIDTAHIADAQITTAKLVDNAVTTVKIVDGNVTTAKIAADAITAAKIADDVINSEHYAAGSIDTEHIGSQQVTHAKLAVDWLQSDNIADDQINSEHYVDGSIDTAHIGDNQVTTAKIADANISTAKIASDAVTNAKIADTSVNTENLYDNAVTTAKLADNAVTGSKITNGSIDANELASSAVTTAKIAADAITGAKIADDAIDSEHYTDGSIDTAHIADSQVTTAKIAGDAITGAKIADDAVNSEHYTDASIDTAHIADGQVTAVKVASNAVTTAKITDSNVTTAKIADSNVTLAKLASDLKQTSISDSDTQIPTSGAVVDYVAAQLSPVGGFEVIATDAAFPNTQPASGVVISIADAGGLVVNGSGTSTTGRTVGGSTVTINNIASNFNSSTVDAGVCFQVSSTGSSQIYNYHKATLKEADLLSLSNDINDFAARYRVQSGEPSSNNDAGDLAFDTAASKMKVYDGSSWGEVTSSGDFKYLVMTNAGTTNAATLNGSTVSFDLKETSTSGSAAAVTSAAQLMVSVNGVIQKPNTGTNASGLDGFVLADSDTITFCAAPASGDDIFIIQTGSAITPTTPADGTVSTAKIASGAVTTAKIADANVTTAKLASDAVTGAKIADDAVGAEHIEQLDADLSFADSVEAKFGAGNDLKLWHNATDSYITNATGDLYIQGNGDDLHIRAADDINIYTQTSDKAIVCVGDGAVELYYDNAVRFQTTAAGATISKAGASAELTIKGGEGESAVLLLSADEADDNADNWRLTAGAGGSINLQNYASGSWENNIECNGNGNVELYYNNLKQAETTNTGFTITNSNTNTTATQVLVKNYNNTVGYLYGSGTSNSDFGLLDAGGDWAVKIVEDSYVELRYDNVKKFETTSTGATITGTLISDGLDLGDGEKIRFGTGNDFEIFHDNSNSNNKVNFDQDLKFRPKGSEDGLTIAVDGAVTLYHDDSWRLRTNSSGGEARNAFTIRGDEGTTATLHMNADEADDGDDMWKLQANTSGEFKIESNNGGSWNDVLKLKDNIYTVISSQRTSQNDYVLKIAKNGSGVNDSVQSTMIVFDVASNGRGKAVSGSSGSSDPQWSTYSDRRLKTNFRNYTAGYDKIKAIPVKLYDEVSNDETKSVIGENPATNCVGWIADEFQAVFPEAVFGTKDAVDSDGKPVFQELAAGTIFPHLVQALQTAITKIETLETKVAALEAG